MAGRPRGEWGEQRVDTRRLQSFVKIVDIGSLTRAADILHIAQPALSQQISGLEAHFGQQLLIRSKLGVVPTEAGRALYRHAQLILRQMEQAQADVATSGSIVSGRVSVGLAPFSTASTLALPLLQQTRARFPDIVLHINENFGGVISEMIMTGRMDVALIYDAGPIRGVKFEPMLTEELFLVAPAGTKLPAEEGDGVPLAALAGLDLLLPTRIHTIRKVVDAALQRAAITSRLVAEIESVGTLAGAIRAGVGASVLPWSAASSIVGVETLTLRRIVKPTIKVRVSVCTSDQLPLSEPAIAVMEVLAELTRGYVDAHGAHGISVAPNRGKRA